MNNKKLGTEFEREVCDLLNKKGYWVHFISPDNRGAQPFDIIAVKNKMAYAIDCKTSVSNRFTMNRVEDNQVLAFDKWISCGNDMPMFFVKYKEHIYMIPWLAVKNEGSVKIDEYYCIS